MPLIREGHIKLAEILYEEKHYPRVKPSTTRIDKYVDDIRKGDKFPPIRLLDGNNSLIDGYHRWKAAIKYKESHETFLLEEPDGFLPDPTDEISCEWHTLPEGVMQLLYASKFQNEFGLGKSEADNRDTARRAYQAQEGIAKTLLEEYIGVSRKKMTDYLSDLEEKHTETVHQMLLRFELLGWSQEEMAEALDRKFPGGKGTSQKTVSNIFSKNGTSAKITEDFSQSNHTIETIAKRHDMPLMLAWALKLQGQPDDDRLKALNMAIQPYDVWHFQGCDDLYGADYPGRIPGQLVAHVLYFFTELGNYVIDPMAGSGTTIDVCLAMGRKCYTYDIHPFHERVDILTHNLKDGWPERTKKADLIFWDPPYFRKKDEGYGDESVSRFNRAEYLKFFADSLKEVRGLVKKGTRLAFLMSDWNSPYRNGDDEEAEDEDTEKGGPIFLWDYTKLMEQAKWNLTYHIQVPLSTQQVHPDIVTKFRKRRQLARLERYLLIAEA